MADLVFEAVQEADGGYCAECLTENIFTQGDAWDELRRNAAAGCPAATSSLRRRNRHIGELPSRITTLFELARSIQFCGRCRTISMLRAHGLIQKVPRTHRYQVTTAGRLVITAILTADRASLSQLNRIAA